MVQLWRGGCRRRPCALLCFSCAYEMHGLFELQCNRWFSTGWACINYPGLLSVLSGSACSLYWLQVCPPDSHYNCITVYIIKSSSQAPSSLQELALQYLIEISRHTVPVAVAMHASRPPAVRMRGCPLGDQCTLQYMSATSHSILIQSHCLLTLPSLARQSAHAPHTCST